MRLLVYPHELTIGGSQINAIDLAAGVAEAGHEVIVYGLDGPLVEYIAARGLRFIPARALRYRPAPSRIAQLLRIARRERIDLIHTYEWPPCLDAYLGAGLALKIPVVCTVLSMSLMPCIPPSLPLIMGTNLLGDTARDSRSGSVWVLEPPIDVICDHPGIDGSTFRKAHAVGDSELLVVCVSRLAIDLKLDALVRAIDAASMLAGQLPIRLVFVGDGPALAALKERAASVNKRWNRTVVSLPGATLDPREAYAAADLVIGMGSSALRGLSIGRPLIVQGESGFSEVFEPATLDIFLHQGFHGYGNEVQGSHRLANQMASLLANNSKRRFLGAYGRRIVVERFSLQRAVKVQLAIYEEALRSPVSRQFGQAARSLQLAIGLEIENHDPFKKRSRLKNEQRLLEAARAGLWPPELTVPP